MKMLLLLIALLPAVTLQQCLTSNDKRENSSSQASLGLAQQGFGLDMLKEISSTNSKGNIFFSPYSVFQALLITYFGAANSTEMELKKALHIDADQDKLSTMQAFQLEKFFQSMRAVNSSGSYELRSSSRLYVNLSINLRECMKQLLEDEVFKIDFSNNPESARVNINSWVESQTRNQIKDLIPAGKITFATQLVLVNAAYFKGLWQSQFLPEHTRKEVFFISPTEQTLVPMMKQKGTFNHMVSERIGAHILELPYKGKDVSMFIFLPPFVKSNAIDSVIQKLEPEALQDIVTEDAFFARQVEVMIPKFSVEQELDLVPILHKMGLGSVFSSNSDLSGFTEDVNLKLSDAIHKAKIDVDEKGTEAAAATAFLFFRSSRPLTPARFVCNHPFVYMLYDRLSQNILFMGVYRRP